VCDDIGDGGADLDPPLGLVDSIRRLKASNVWRERSD
jgi:hypothetical protein